MGETPKKRNKKAFAVFPASAQMILSENRIVVKGVEFDNVLSKKEIERIKNTA